MSDPRYKDFEGSLRKKTSLSLCISFAGHKAAQLLERVEPCCQKHRYQMKTSFFKEGSSSFNFLGLITRALQYTDRKLITTSVLFTSNYKKMHIRKKRKNVSRCAVRFTNK